MPWSKSCALKAGNSRSLKDHPKVLSAARRILPALRQAFRLIFCVTILSVPARADEVSFEDQVRPLLQKHCVKCHGSAKQKGDFRLDTLATDFSEAATASAWLEVRDNINLGEMPPDGETPLEGEEVALISGWIIGQQRAVEHRALSAGDRVVLRRLNREEYTSTVADLLHLKFPPGESPLDFLPPDGTAEGFNKVSAALLLDPSLMQLYYEVARGISERALVDGPPAFPTETMRLEFEEIDESRAIGYLTTRLGMRPLDDGLLLIDGSTRSFGLLNYPGERGNNVAPIPGFYRFTIRAGGITGENGPAPRLAIRQGHPKDEMRLVAEFEVKAPLDQPAEYSFVVARDELGGEINVEIVPGTSPYQSQRPGEEFRRFIEEVGKEKQFSEVLRLRGRQLAEGAGGDRSTPDPEKIHLEKHTRVFLDWLEIEGPLYEQWPPRSHEGIFFKGDGAEETLSYAREIFARFTPRAWRRPVPDQEIEPIIGIVKNELAHGQTFLEAIRVGLTAVLTSPKFLYLFEPGGGNATRRLNDYEIASRLSYFLWNSMPDERLFELAAAGRLRDPKTLEEETNRLLANEKKSRFVGSFARQWLRTDSYLAFAPNQYLYKEYTPKLGKAAVTEPLVFFDTVLRDDLSVLNFIDSDFAMVNEALARHYGISGVEGDHFRRVTLDPASPRGGLLGMMGVHLAGSDGLRTKPVARAVFVREVLFNDSPDPPPPNAGEIEPNIKGERLTVRERLQQHQEIESCAGCHRRLDPYGLALENFNVIGKWREQQDGEDFRHQGPPIVIDEKLPGGEAFHSYGEFRSLLLARSDRFRRALAEKLWIYALGRPVEPTDDGTLQAAIERMKEEGDTLRALIQSIVTSPQFLSK